MAAAMHGKEDVGMQKAETSSMPHVQGKQEGTEEFTHKEYIRLKKRVHELECSVQKAHKILRTVSGEAGGEHGEHPHELLTGHGELDAATPGNIEHAVVTLRRVILKDIKSKLVYKDNVRTGQTKWSFDGVITMPVLLSFMHLDATTKLFQRKQVKLEEFLKMLGESPEVTDHDVLLKLTGDHVNFSYFPDSGEVKISGYYGIEGSGESEFVTK
jgi:hypothetical protein